MFVTEYLIGCITHLHNQTSLAICALFAISTQSPSKPPAITVGPLPETQRAKYIPKKCYTKNISDIILDSLIFLKYELIKTILIIMALKCFSQVFHWDTDIQIKYKWQQSS